MNIFSNISIGLMLLAWVIAAVFGNTNQVEDQAIACSVLSIAGIAYAIRQIFKTKECISWLNLILLFPFAFYFIWRASISDVEIFGIGDVLLVSSVIITIHVARVTNPKYVLWCMAGISLLFGFAALSQKFDFQIPFFRDRRIDKFGVSAFYGHRIFYGDFLAGISLFFASALVFDQSSKKKKALYVTILAFSVLQVVISSSRGPLVFIGVGLFCLAGLNLIKAIRSKATATKKLLLVFGCLGVLLSGGLYFSLAKGQLLDSRFNKEESLLSNNSRSHYNKAAIQLVSKGGWIGEGSNSFSYSAASESRGISFYNSYRMSGLLAHNEYLQVLTDYGIVGGLCMFLFLVLLAFRIAYELFMRDEFPKQWYFLAGVVVVCGHLAHATVNAVFHTLPNLMLFGVALGFILKPLQETKDQQARGRKIITAVLISFVALLMLKQSIPYVKIFFEEKKAFAQLGEARFTKLEKIADRYPDYRRYKVLAKELHSAAENAEKGSKLQKVNSIRSAEMYEKSFAFHPKSLANYMAAIQLQRVASRYSDVQRLSLEAIEKFPLKALEAGFYMNLAESNYYLGLIYWDKSEYENAKNHFLKANLIYIQHSKDKLFRPHRWRFVTANNAMLALNRFREAGAVGEELYFNREPEKALGAYEYAMAQYQLSKKVKLNNDEREKWQKLEKGVQQRIKFLKGAKVEAEEFILPSEN